MISFMFAAIVLASSLSFTPIRAFNPSAENNLAVYWGQGANQQPLNYFCNDDTIDVILIAFVNVFPDQSGTNGYPGTNFGNACGGTYTTKDGKSSELLGPCTAIQSDIKYCQARGKKIFLSLGGGASPGVFIDTTASAQSFADFLWGAFGPQQAQWVTDGNPRPFGDASVDGFDFDIESSANVVGASKLSFGYADMINRLRASFASASPSTFYISGAPQCIVPDAHLADALANSYFDFIFVQFYNTPQCSARAGIDHTYGEAANGGQPTDISFTDWVSWVTQNSANPAARIYLGLAASPDGTFDNMYLSPSEAQQLISKFQCMYPDNFGGVSLWEATFSNNNVEDGKTYAQNIKAELGSVQCNAVSTTSTTSSSTTAISSSTTTSSTTATGTSTSTLTTISAVSTFLPTTISATSTTVQPTTSTLSTPTTSATSTYSGFYPASASSSSSSSTKSITMSTSSCFSYLTSSCTTSTTGSGYLWNDPSPSTSSSNPYSSSWMTSTSSTNCGSLPPLETSSSLTMDNAEWQSMLPLPPMPPCPTSSTSSSSPSSAQWGVYETTITTWYIDICPTGFTTVLYTTTATLTWGAEPTSWADSNNPYPPPPPPPGWTTTITVCDVCAATPTTVTLTRPCSETSSDWTPPGPVPVVTLTVVPVPVISSDWSPPADTIAPILTSTGTTWSSSPSPYGTPTLSPASPLTFQTSCTASTSPVVGAAGGATSWVPPAVTNGSPFTPFKGAASARLTNGVCTALVLLVGSFVAMAAGAIW